MNGNNLVNFRFFSCYPIHLPTYISNASIVTLLVYLYFFLFSLCSFNLNPFIGFVLYRIDFLLAFDGQSRAFHH